jgi:hypothetical protein
MPTSFIPQETLHPPTPLPLNHCLLGNLDTTSGTERTLDVTVDGELTSGQGTDHEETGTKTSERSTETELASNLEETAGGALTWETLGLVDLGQHGIGWLGDDGGSKTGNETRAEIDGSVGGRAGGSLVNGLVKGLGDLFVDDELGHGVWDPALSVIIASEMAIKVLTA